MLENLRSTYTPQKPGINPGWIVLLIFSGSGLIAYGLWRYSPIVLKNRPFPIFLVDRLNQRGINSPRWLHIWASRSALSPIGRVYLTIPDALFWLGARVKTVKHPLNRPPAWPSSFQLASKR